MEHSFLNSSKKQNRTLSWPIYIRDRTWTQALILMYNLTKNVITMQLRPSSSFLLSKSIEEANLVLTYIIACWKNLAENFHGNKSMTTMIMFTITQINLTISLKVVTKMCTWLTKNPCIDDTFWMNGMINWTKSHKTRIRIVENFKSKRTQ